MKNSGAIIPDKSFDDHSLTIWVPYVCGIGWKVRHQDLKDPAALLSFICKVLAQPVIMPSIRVSSSLKLLVCINHPLIMSSVRVSSPLESLVCIDTITLPLSVIVACESHMRARLGSE